MIAEGADINERDNFGRSALCQVTSKEKTELLVRAGVDPNYGVAPAGLADYAKGAAGHAYMDVFMEALIALKAIACMDRDTQSPTPNPVPLLLKSPAATARSNPPKRPRPPQLERSLHPCLRNGLPPRRPTTLKTVTARPYLFAYNQQLTHASAHSYRRPSLHRRPVLGRG